VLVPWRLPACLVYYCCWPLSWSVSLLHLATRHGTPSQHDLLLLHRCAIGRLFLLCLSEQGEPAAETHQTLHARWIPPRLTGAQGIALVATLEERKARPCLLAGSATHARLGTTRHCQPHSLSSLLPTIATLSRDQPIITPRCSLTVNKPIHIDSHPDLTTPPTHICILKPTSITPSSEELRPATRALLINIWSQLKKEVLDH
jgi:hypothetical protein